MKNWLRSYGNEANKVYPSKEYFETVYKLLNEKDEREKIQIINKLNHGGKLKKKYG